jgi:hypothetical protein
MPAQIHDLFTKPTIELLRLRDVFAYVPSPPPREGTKTRLRLPLPNSPLIRTMPNGLIVQVEWRDGRLWLILGPGANGVRMYEVIAKDMPRLDWHLESSGNHHHLPYAPPNLFILDSTNHWVRTIYAIEDGQFGSRYELRLDYASHNLSRGQRSERAAARQLKSISPSLHSDMLDYNVDITTVVRRRLRGMQKREIIKRTVRARWGSVRKGEHDKLNEAVDLALNYYSRRRTGAIPKGKKPPAFHRTLAPLNKARREMKRRRKEWEEPPPIANTTGLR